MPVTYDENSILNLISHIHTQSQTFLQKKLASLGLAEMATSHGNILYCLTQTKELTLSELSQKINRDKSTTTALVKKLETAGLVELKKDSTDSRKKKVCLTAQGSQYTARTTTLSEELIAVSWKNFKEDEKQTLVTLLNKLSGNLE